MAKVHHQESKVLLPPLLPYDPALNHSAAEICSFPFSPREWCWEFSSKICVSLRLDGNYYRTTAVLHVVVWIVFPQCSCMCVEIFNISLIVWLHSAWLFSICYTALILGSKQIQLSHFSLLFYGELHMESMSYKRFWAKQTHGFHVSLGTRKASIVLLKVKNRIKFHPLTCKTQPNSWRCWVPHTPTCTSCV